jgi:hypothetical protein
MRTEPSSGLLEQAARWATLPRRQRAELGRALRRLGWTYTEIREVIPVPKATLAGWCRDIVLTDTQVAAIEERTGSRRGVPRDTQRRRRAEVERIRSEAQGFAHEHLHDPLFVAGTVLYWGEGAKTSPRLAVANADVRTIRLFLRWVEEFHSPASEFVFALHLHEGNDEQDAKDWWRRAIGLERAEFTKTFIKPAGTGHRKKRLPQGVCRVSMRRSADAWHRTMAWIDALAGSLASDGPTWRC